MDSIFTRIIKNEIPAYKIAENQDCIAFLDIFPLQKGHTLVIPKKQVDKLFDLDDDTYQGLWNFAKKVSAAIEKSFDCNRVGVVVMGLEVPHAHIHLIPINGMRDMDFSNPKLKLSKEEFEQIAQIISSNL